MTGFIHKIQRRLLKFRLEPIRVLCFHQTSRCFDESTMWDCDWIQIDQFKECILSIQRECTFISLSEAYRMIKENKYRKHKYAVLTADDGWKSLEEILPWLSERGIPITLFINPLYLDGKHFQDRDTEKLYTDGELEELQNIYPNISIASHGWSHMDTTKLSNREFAENVQKAELVLKKYKNKIPFYAFTYGRYRKEFLACLKDNHLIPVLIDGMVNIKFDGVIHRESIEKLV